MSKLIFKNYSFIFLIPALFLLGCASSPKNQNTVQPASGAKERAKELVVEPKKENNAELETLQSKEPLYKQTTDELIKNKLILSILPVEFVVSGTINDTLKTQCNTLVVSSAKNNGTAYHIVSYQSLTSTVATLEQALQFQYELPVGETYVYPNLLLKTVCLIPDANTLELKGIYEIAINAKGYKVYKSKIEISRLNLRRVEIVNMEKN